MGGGWLRIPEAKTEAYKNLNMLVERSGLEVGTIGGHDKFSTHQAGRQKVYNPNLRPEGQVCNPFWLRERTGFTLFNTRNIGKYLRRFNHPQSKIFPRK